MVGGGELVVIAMVVVLVGVQLGALVALIAWGLWVARKLGGGAWSAAAWMPVAGVVLQLAGSCASAALLLRAFETVAAVPADVRSARLADGISSAMNLGAITFVAAILLYGASVVVFAIGTARVRGARGPRDV